MQIERRVVIITGGAAGIGKGIAECFAMEQDCLVIADHNEQDGLAAQRELASRYGIEAIFVKTDVSRERDAEEAVHQALRRWGRVDVLVNNVGTHLYKRMTDFELSEWDRLMEVDLRGCFLMSRCVLRHMVSRRQGAIVNISSVHGSVSDPLYTAYAAAKGGVVSMTRSMAAEYAPDGIRVNAVLPGWTRNKSLDQKLAQYGEEEQEQMLRRWGRAIPLGRIADPQDVGHAVVFLASDKASYITGTCLTVDGGLSSTMMLKVDE